MEDQYTRISIAWKYTVGNNGEDTLKHNTVYLIVREIHYAVVVTVNSCCRKPVVFFPRSDFRFYPEEF